MQALALTHHELQLSLLAIAIDVEAVHGLDRFENANESFVDAILHCNLSGALVFSVASRGQIKYRAACACGDGQRCFFNARANLLSERAELFEQHSGRREETRHAVGVSDGTN